MDMYQIHPMHNMKSIYDIIIRPNMHLAMVACGLFIFISGATITYNIRAEKPLKFYKRRLLRVLIPFYIAYIIYFVIKVITLKSIHIFGGVEKWKIIYTLIGMDEYLNAAGFKTFSLGIGEWFLGCIILCYLAYPFLYRAHKNNKIFTFAVMSIYYILINLNYDKLNTTMPSHFNFLCQVYNFYLGIASIDVISKMKNRESATRKGGLREPFCLLAITIPITLFFFFFKSTINIPDNFKTTIVVVAVFISFYLFENALASNSFLVKIISLFSPISYEFFLVHHFVIYQIDYMLNYRRLGGAMTVLVIIVDFILTVLIAEIVKIISVKINKRYLEFYRNYDKGSSTRLYK